MSLVVRTSGDPTSLAGPLRRTVAALDPELAVSNVRPLLELLSDSLAASRFIMALLGGFALLGLALATVGVYGVVAGSVERRTGEIGLRLAIGADSRDVLAMVMGQAARLAAAGVTLGLLAAFALTRVMPDPALRRERRGPSHLRRHGRRADPGHAPGELPPGAAHLADRSGEGAAGGAGGPWGETGCSG
jgi:hypothetical protein